jgi:hypothetical protein
MTTLSQVEPHSTSFSFYLPLAPAKPTEVYFTYWCFAAARQDIFFRRLDGASPPYTDDLVLQRYKFTNAYRASDRVSQYLIRNILYKGEQSVDEIFFRTLMFKFFNKIETWELLQSNFGTPSYKDYKFEHYDEILTQAMERGIKIFSNAYIMPSGRSDLASPRKHRTYLHLLEIMMRDNVASQIAESRSMKQAFLILRSYPLIGDFLAYQYITDLNYSSMVDFSEMEFVVPGPGALNGISKCFSDLGGLTEAETIKFVTERQQEEFERLEIDFSSLWGRKLQLIDCQNLFCEVDKYARVAHPTHQGKSQRTRIKQLYRPLGQQIDFWYPPKWDINTKIGNRD